MIRFIVGSMPGQDPGPLRLALFELGVRLGSRFSVQIGPAAVPREGHLVFYGPRGAAGMGGRASCDLPRAGADTPCEPHRMENGWCYAAGPEGGWDVVAGTAELLTFRHEQGNRGRDRFGRIPARAHPLWEHLQEPLLENNAGHLRRLLRGAFGELPRESSPWGEDTGALVLTHDVDGPQLHSPFPLFRALLKALLGDPKERESFLMGVLTFLGRRPDPYWNFEEWAALESLAHARSTFFVYPGAGPGRPRHRHDPHYDPRQGPFPAVLAALAQRRWEFGVHHGIRAHGPAAYAASRDAMSRLCGTAATGSRSHYWCGVWETPLATWKAMDEAGYGYDASLTPQGLGYRCGNMLPTMPSLAWRAGVRDGFIALPTALMDAYAHPDLSSHEPGSLDPSVSRLIANAREGGLLVTDWHVRTFANAGAHRGQLEVFLEKVLPLCRTPGWITLTAGEATERWRAHCARCWVPEAS